MNDSDDAIGYAVTSSTTTSDSVQFKATDMTMELNVSPSTIEKSLGEDQTFAQKLASLADEGECTEELIIHLVNEYV